MISKSTILRIYAIRMVAMVNNKPQSAQKMTLTSEGSQRTVVDPRKNFDRNLVTELKYCVRECTDLGNMAIEKPKCEFRDIRIPERARSPVSMR